MLIGIAIRSSTSWNLYGCSQGVGTLVSLNTTTKDTENTQKQMALSMAHMATGGGDTLGLTR